MRVRARLLGILSGLLLVGAGAGAVWADYYAYTRTPRRSPVSVIVMTWELSADEIDSMNEYWADAYPQATLLGSCSRKYNCHSYAWYAQFATSVWINDPARYWTDGSYVRTTTVPPRSGEKVFYPGDADGSHSAVSQGGGIMVSKWGQAPLMRHGLKYGPYYMAVYRSYRRAQ
ncbi:MAG: hypothetical protein HYZ53_04170 [Planctomycetes bacterium]|nr:hypothetical protein [Planctomycetota bacterium]